MNVANQARSVTDVDVSGYTLTLTLASAVHEGESVQVRYEQPASGTKLQDRNGNVVKTFGFKAAENRTDERPPYLLSMTLNGTQLTLTYNEDLDPGSVPARDAFTLTSGGAPVSLADTTPVAVTSAVCIQV